MARQEKKFTFSQFAKKTIGVVGDIMLDHSLFCEIERISPEAPVPIARVVSEKFVPGGAGNTAANIASLGGKADLVGLVGSDAAGDAVRAELVKRGVDAGGIMRDPLRGTIQKIRVIGQGQQIARIDRENISPSSRGVEKNAADALASRIPGWDAVVVSDYEKGFFTKKLASTLLAFARAQDIPVVVNTKPNNFPFFRGADVFIPNTREAEGVLGRKFFDEADVRKGGAELTRKFRAHIVMTRGVQGITLFSGRMIHHLPARALEVFDVTGASDTVVAVFSLAYTCGFSLKDAVAVANAAAGIVVGKRGTATISLEELRAVYV